MQEQFARMIDSNLGVEYECTECKHIFFEITKNTYPGEYSTCQCGKSAFDVGDGYYIRYIGAVQRVRR